MSENKSNTQLSSKMTKYCKEASEGNAIWRSNAAKCYSFVDNEQWLGQDAVSKARLEKEGKPALTINHIFPVVNLLSGMERGNRQDIKVYPRKGSNRIVCDVLTGLCKHTTDISDAEFEQSMQFIDGVISGKGWLSLDISYNNDFFNGDLVIERDSPMDIEDDPNCSHYDINRKAKYTIKYYWADKEWLNLKYPKIKAELNLKLKELSEATNCTDVYDPAYNTSKSSDKENRKPELLKFRLKEIHWKEYVNQLFLIDKRNLSFTKVHKTQKDLVQALLNKDRQLAYQEGRREKFILKERVIPVLHCTDMLGDLVLNDVEDPYNGMTLFPLIRFCPYWFDKNMHGLVEYLLDPQREINKRSSQFLHILNQTANGGWIVDENSMNQTDIDNLKKVGSSTGVVVKYHGNNPPQKIKPNELPAGHFTIKQDEVNNIRIISALNTANRGQQEKEESGIALLRRQRQGEVASAIIFDNFRRSQQILGKTLVEMISKTNVYSPQEILQVMQKEKVNISIEQIYNAIRSFKNAHYGIKVAQRPSTPTIRLANFEMLAQLLQAGIPIPIDILLENMDIPRKEEVIQRVRKSQMAQQQMEMAKTMTGQGAAQKGKASQPKMQSKVNQL